MLHEIPQCYVMYDDRMQMVEAHWIFAMTSRNDMAYIDY